MNENTVTITLKEYTELKRTAWRFELLRREAAKGYTTDLEKALFEFPEVKEGGKNEAVDEG